MGSVISPLLGCQWFRMKVDTVAVAMMGYHCRWKWKHRFLAMWEESLRIVASDTSEYCCWIYFCNVQRLLLLRVFVDGGWMCLAFFWYTRTPRAFPAHTHQKTEVTCYRLCHGHLRIIFVISIYYDSCVHSIQRCDFYRTVFLPFIQEWVWMVWAVSHFLIPWHNP